MSHLFEIESAVFIKPYIFILASEAGRGLWRLSGVLSGAFLLTGVLPSPRPLPHTVIPLHCSSRNETSESLLPPKLTCKSETHSPAPTSQLVSSPVSATRGTCW